MNRSINNNTGGYNQSRQGNNQRPGYQNNRNGSQSDRGVKYIPEAIELPTDYIDKAAEIMSTCHNYISSTKLRSILSMVSAIYNAERDGKDMLSETSLNSLKMLRIRILYEYGRNNDDFKKFIRQSHILDYLLSVGNDRRKFIEYAHYLEAIVAYHRFYGGK